MPCGLIINGFVIGGFVMDGFVIGGSKMHQLGNVKLARARCEIALDQVIRRAVAHVDPRAIA